MIGWRIADIGMSTVLPCHTYALTERAGLKFVPPQCHDTSVFVPKSCLSTRTAPPSHETALTRPAPHSLASFEYGRDSMRRILAIGIMALLLAAFGAAVGLAGLRIVLMPVGQDQPGRTIVATGLGDLRLIDSPAAYCARNGDEDPTCPISFRMAVAHEGTVLLDLPYVAALEGLTGAPAP
jgi:hypothetical protein